MVIFGGLELVAAGYIVHKHSKNKKEKQRLEEEAAAIQSQQAQQPSHHRRKHSHDRKHSNSPHRKHSHDNKHTYEGRRPLRESRPQQVPQYLNTDTSQPPRASSAPPAGYPPTGWPAHWNAPPQQQVYPPNAYPTNYGAPPTYPQQNQYSQPPPFNVTRDMDQKSASPPQDIPSRGHREPQASSSAAELSTSGPRMYNTHLSPTPHVRFAVPNDGPQPGDGFDPPPEYRA